MIGPSARHRNLTGSFLFGYRRASTYGTRLSLANLPERRTYMWRRNASFAPLLDHPYH